MFDSSYDPCSCPLRINNYKGSNYCDRHFLYKTDKEWMQCLRNETHRFQEDNKYGINYKDIEEETRNCLKEKESIKQNFFSESYIYENEKLSRTKIAVLGHKKCQYDNIKDQPYLQNFLLQDLDLGIYNKYQRNCYAESRAFYCDNIFDFDNFDYVGVVTASWNSKFNGLRIDEFDSWQQTNILYNNSNVILTAESCFPHKQSSIFDMFKIDFSNDYLDLIYSFIEKNYRIGIWSNQIICHKSIYIKLQNFHRKIIKPILDQNFPLTLKKEDSMYLGREIGLLLELATCLWISSNPDLIILDTSYAKHSWFQT